MNMSTTKQPTCTGKKCYCTTRLDGKTVIITGATAGLGKESAKLLAARGAKVIMAVRNLEKAGPIVQELIQETGNSNIVSMKLDLASLQSVVDFVKEFKEKEERLDVLMNNAGVFMLPKATTVDGYDYVFQSNYLGHFLLTYLLLDLLKKSSPSRIINVSSIIHKKGDITFDDLNREKEYSHIPVYGQTKLAQVLSTRHLAKMLEGTGVLVFAVHPGMVKTDILQRENMVDFSSKLFYYCVNPIFGFLIGKTTEQGALTQVHCSVAPGIEQLSGSYFDDCKVAAVSSKARDDQVADKLWKVSLEMVKQFID